MKALKLTARKTLALLLTFVLVLSLPLCINAATVNTATTGEILTGNCGANGNNVTYNLDTSTGVLTISGSGAMKDYNEFAWLPWEDDAEHISVKSVIINDGITTIGVYAFSSCRSLTNVEIPSSVTSIGKGAFFNCPSLTNIEIPSGVTSIGDSAFQLCDSLTGVKIPSGVTSIGSSAFNYCRSLTNIEIPSSVTSIGEEAFYCCSSLTNVEIPSSVTSIGNYAFDSCSSLTNIEIPSSVTSIGYGTFSNCSLLTNINVNAENNTYCSIDGVLFNKDVTTLVCCPSGKTSVEIPSSVTSIEKKAFYCCSSLTNVEIPSGVTSIGNSAFSSCSSLTNIEIPSNVTSIGENVFSNCSSLTGVKISSSVTSIGDGAFLHCRSLTNVEIPSSVTSIGNSAFGSCSSLTNVEIPSSVTSIGRYAFKDCSKLTSACVYNKDATFGSYVFRGAAADFTLYGYDNSTAQTYATENNHTFVSLDKKITVYFSNNRFWDSVYCYYWTGDLNNTWPGEAMTFVETNGYGEDIYKIEVPANASVIFNNNAWEQTVDIETVSDGIGYYTTELSENNTWNVDTYDYAQRPVLKIEANNGIESTVINYDRASDIDVSDINVPAVDKNVFLGLYSDAERANALQNPFSLLAGENIIYSGFENIGTLNAEAEDKTGSTATTSGFDLFGAQFREKTESRTSGLRFCTRVSKDLVSKIEGKTGNSVECGYVLCKKDSVPENAELKVGMTTTGGSTIKENSAPIRYYDGNGYFVYTAVIVNIPDEMQGADIVARPYIKYTDVNGIQRYYYFTESGASNCGGGYYTSYTAVQNAHNAAQG